MTILSCENVGLRYESGPEILCDVSFELEPASFCFLTGPSGAGKTSLLTLLFLARLPTRGLITMFGEDVATLTRSARALVRRRIGVVFQECRLLDHLTVFENVVLPLRIASARRKAQTRDVIELLNWVGLGDRMHAYPPILSGGEKQRVAIARAVAAQPDLLIADEPTGNVDPEMAARLLRLFIELNRTGASVVIATHDPALVGGALAHARILKLDRGRVIDQTPGPEDQYA